jgi:sugar phosphate isomerase/epimerase
LRTPHVSRRSLLAGGAAALGAAVSGPAAAAPFFQRTRLPIGIQLYSLGPEAAKDVDATFAEVAKIGFRTVELAGFMGRKPAEFRAALDRAGLACTNAHVQARAFGPDPALDGDLGVLAEALNAVGAEQAVMPLFYIPQRFGPPSGDFVGYLRRVAAGMTADDWAFNADFLNEKAAALRKAGVRLGYHNHNCEFAPLGRSNGMEILLERTDPALVNFEIDVGWVAAAGADPVALLKRHRGRFNLMHVKDLKPSTKANFGLQMDPTEVGSGAIDWRRLLPAAHAAGVRHFFFEQEPPFARSRIEAARISHDFLAGVEA